jgi:hypothetical protein
MVSMVDTDPPMLIIIYIISIGCHNYNNDNQDLAPEAQFSYSAQCSTILHHLQGKHNDAKQMQ